MWPSDDDVREHNRKETFADDGRKLTDSEHVGENAPDADGDAEPPPGRPARR